MLNKLSLQLSYKEPTFWVIIVSLIAVITISFGFVTNKTMTVEDFANQYVEEQIANYHEWQTFKVIDSKIIKLEKIATFDNLLEYNIEIWSLEYRLKPDDISKVTFPGGMNEIDGWITEDSSMGKPVLIFSYENQNPELLGITWSGEEDFSTFAGQETALRKFLESEGILPPETYKGNHVVVKFPLSTGETCQLLLSQPVNQGDKGIWCAERWMDGNGYVYYVTPKTEFLIDDYHKELQTQCDNGHSPALLDPEQVALDFINNGLGQNVSIDELEVQYSAQIEDFLQTPER